MHALQQATHLHRRPTSSSSPIRAASASQRVPEHQANRQRELVATMSAAAVQPTELNEQRSNGNGLHAEQPFPLMMVPLRQTKTIHFIRHGQGFHNVAGHANHDNYKSEEWFDAHLTAEGWRQAEDLNSHIVSSGLQVDLVVVSPMMRALETAVGAFGRQPLAGSEAALMVQRKGDNVHSVARPAVSTQGAPSFIAHEMAREIIGVHPCDRRRTLSEYKTLFPGVDWSLIAEESDTLWTREQRESKTSVIARGRQLLRFLMQRPESSIAVVTHSTLLHYTLNSFGQEFAEPVQGELHRWFENCEMRSIVVANTVEAMPDDKYHHKGGPPPPRH